MTAEPKRIQIDSSTDIVALAEEVRNMGEDKILEREGEALARLTPVGMEKRNRSAFSPDDPIWNIVGMDTSEGEPDTSQSKHEYIADAIGKHFHR